MMLSFLAYIVAFAVFGFGLVLVGMACFLGGLDLALFPVGRSMAVLLAEGAKSGGAQTWLSYGWVYLFAFMVGFSSTLSIRREPISPRSRMTVPLSAGWSEEPSSMGHPRK